MLCQPALVRGIPRISVPPSHLVTLGEVDTRFLHFFSIFQLRMHSGLAGTLGPLVGRGYT